MFRRIPLFLLCALTAFGAPESLRVQWDANSEPDLAGYRLRLGSAPGVVERVIDVGLVTTATVVVTNLTYLTVIAYNTAGLESEPSNEISFSPTGTEMEKVNGFLVGTNQYTP